MTTAKLKKQASLRLKMRNFESFPQISLRIEMSIPKRMRIAGFFFVKYCKEFQSQSFDLAESLH